MRFIFIADLFGFFENIGARFFAKRLDIASNNTVNFWRTGPFVSWNYRWICRPYL